MTTSRPLLVRALVAATIAVAVIVSWSGPAAAQGGERISNYQVDLTVEESGSLVVTEVIDYDFGPNARRGILRNIPVRYPYEPDPDFERILRLEVIDVSTEGGAPDQYEVEGAGDFERIRIGDPDRTITGEHTYTLRYRIEGALNGFADHDELFWNAIGAEWDVPIEQASVQVTTPAAVTDATCFAGPVGSQLPCGGIEDAAAQQRGFQGDSLTPGEALTVVVGFEPGVVADTAPILEEIWTIQSAFALTPATLGASGGLLAVVFAGVGLLAWRVGRDHRFVGSATDIAFGSDAGHGERVPMFADKIIPVEFVPPDNVRPGEVGTLVDETAHPLDVVATIIDLAVRRYLTIEEVPGEGWRSRPDWRLWESNPVDAELHEYEAVLLRGLFDGRDSVLLSDLKGTFAKDLSKAQDALYDEVVDEGWFHVRPDHTRATWIGIGAAVFVVGALATALVAWQTSFGLVPIPIAIAGLTLLIGAKWLPRRTPAGTGMLRRVLGFKRFIDESEADRARFAEKQHLFSEYLPYAVVFGVTEKWAKAFEGIDGQLPQPNWYTGNQIFTTLLFVNAMDGFTTTTAGTISSVPQSSAAGGMSGFGGGGFSGGGFGGGGGGSW